MNEPVKDNKISANTRMLSARLSAVQAFYQIMHNKTPMKSVVREYLEHRTEMEIEGEKLVAPDKVKFKTILFGVDERLLELEEIVNANLSRKKGDEGQEKSKSLDPLLKAILLCGAYELLSCQDVDSAIIINDYLHVTHAFYEKGEASLVNGILDAISKLLRV